MEFTHFAKEKLLRVLSLFILIDCSIHIDTVSNDLSILYFNGLPVRISLK